jgi:hypothetical protein
VKFECDQPDIAVDEIEVTQADMIEFVWVDYDSSEVPPAVYKQG